LICAAIDVQVVAPAKINLWLHLKGRRADGYHEIESLVCPISVFDRLDITPTETGAGVQLRCNDPTLPQAADNLAVRAALVFFGETGIEPNVTIDLEKTIPHGAGLGGGSSDAAAVLLALDRMFETHLPRETLAAMAGELGSDVPFFVYQSAAIVRGRGETVVPSPFPHRLPLLLIKPPFGVPTAWAYSRWAESRSLRDAESAQEFPWGTLQNDLERPVFEKYLFLASLKQWLRAQEEVAGALLAGSGSTVFAILRAPETAEGLAGRIGARFGGNLWIHACETIDVHAIGGTP
jgi:4-diphosphocytidyl-2-C-methyl-D-erythritol kinase